MWSFLSGNQPQQQQQQTSPQKQREGGKPASSGWGSFFGGTGQQSAEKDGAQPEKASEVVVSAAPKLTQENYKELGQKMVADFIFQSNAGKEDGWEVQFSKCLLHGDRKFMTSYLPLLLEYRVLKCRKA